MAVLVDTFKRVRFDPDGQGIDLTDMHTMQAVALKAQLEMFLLSGVTDVIGDPSDPTSTAVQDFERGLEVQSDTSLDFRDMLWTPCAASGYIAPGGTALSLVTTAGVVVQLVDGADGFSGDVDQLLAFRIPAGTTLTNSAAHATLNRIDLVEIKLELVDGVEMVARDFEDATTRVPTSQSTDVAKKVQCTIQIKAGTAGASPTYPAPTAGFVPIAAVYIPAAWGFQHSIDNLRDMRWPIGGFRTYDVNANQMYSPGATQWTINETGQYMEAPTVGLAPLYAICPTSMKTARLLGVGIMGEAGATPTVDLVRVAHAAGTAPTITSVAAIDAGDIFDTGGFYKVGALFLMDVLGDSLGIAKGARLANRRIGSPLWCNADPAGPARFEQPITNNPTQLGVKIVSDVGGTVAFVRFYVAHGM